VTFIPFHDFNGNSIDGEHIFALHSGLEAKNCKNMHR